MQKSGLTIVAVLLILFIIIAAGFAHLSSTYNPESPLSPQPSSKTTTTGDITEAVLSPDGRTLIYGVDEGGGRQSLRIVMPESARSLDDSSPIEFPDETASYNGLAISPDGNYLYYVKYSGSEAKGDLYRLDIRGAKKGKTQPDKIREQIPRAFTFSVSPDGNHLAFVLEEKGSQPQSSLNIFEINRRAERPIRVADDILVVAPAWKPTRESLIYAAKPADHAGVKLVEVSADDKGENNPPQRKDLLNLDVESIRNIAWVSDGSGLLVSTSDRVFGSYQISYVSYPDGVRQQLLDNVPKNSFGISMAADSTKLVTVQDKLEAGIWHVEDVNENRVRKPEIKEGGPNDFYGFAWVSDTEIVYQYLDGRKQNLFLKNIKDNSPAENLTNDVGDNYDPSVTPDKQTIVFASTRTGRNRIWKMDRNGRNQTLLTGGNSDGEHTLPFCSPYGDWVYYTSKDDMEKYTLRRVRLDGTGDEQVRDEYLLWPAVSTEGKIACFNNDGKKIRLAISAPGDSGQQVNNLAVYELPPSANTWAELRWVNRGQAKGITFINTEKDDRHNFVSNLRWQPEAGGGQEQLTRFESGRIFRYEWSPDRKQLILSRGRITRNAHLIDIHRPTRLEDIAKHPILTALRQHSWWLGSGATFLSIIIILFFTDLPLKVLADKSPLFNSVATFLYYIRLGDWRIFRTYRNNLLAELKEENANTFYKPLPVEHEDRECILAGAVVERVLDLVKDHPVIVTGTGGAGKSTLLRQLALGCLEGGQLGKRLPVFIDPDITNEGSLKTQLANYLKGSSSYITEEILDGQLKKGSFFFIIDGISELTEAQVRKVCKEMHSLFPLAGEKDQENVIVLAGRYSEGIKFQRKRHGEEVTPRKVEMLHVNPEDLKTFCREYIARMRGKDPSQITDETVKPLIDNLERLPNTPLFIKLAAEVFEKTGQAPRSTLDLFRDILSPKKEGLRVHTPALFTTMHHLAWEKFVKGGQRELYETDLLGLIGRIDEETGLLSNRQGEKVAPETILHDLLQSGIMTRQFNRISFWHDSFEDYLCAYHFLRIWSDRREGAQAYLRKIKAERALSEIKDFITRMARETADPELERSLVEPTSQVSVNGREYAPSAG